MRKAVEHFTYWWLTFVLKSTNPGRFQTPHLNQPAPQVMSAPFSRRSCNRPVLKSGYKWPCYTLHSAPMLAPPLETCSDQGAS